MIADQETNVVLVADTLELEFPAVYSGLRDILERHEIPLRTIPGTRSIWCRDYMPIQVAKDRFVQFRYAPDYLNGKYRHLRADGQIGLGLPQFKNCVQSDIVLDGGNVVGGSDRVIVCDKVFRENPKWKPSELLRELKDLLGVEQVIDLPTEQGDIVGHADGVVRFINDNVVLANDYEVIDGRYRAALKRRLRRAGLEVVEIPYRPVVGKARGIPPASGCYINYLKVGRLIVLPRFGLPEDEEARRQVQGCFSDSDVQSLDCSSLSAEGGVLNCATWTVFSSVGIEEESPDRSADSGVRLTG